MPLHMPGRPNDYRPDRPDAVKRRLFLIMPVSPLDTGVHLSELSKKVGPPQFIGLVLGVLNGPGA